MTTVQEALDYLRMGLSIIPLQPRDKRPAISSWAEFQERKPTENEVRTWFKDESLNVGIVCGAVSGDLVVIDFDSSETLPFVLSDVNKISDETLVVRTGKGFHFYYRRPGVHTSKLSNLKIDIKAEGGYVVAPPSYHPSGVQYARVGTLSIKNAKEDLFVYLKELEEIFPIARVIAARWESGSRHEMALRLGAFFKARARWPEEKTIELIKGIMRFKGDFAEVEDRVRAIKDAYREDYGYNGLPADLVEELVRFLPRGAGEIWVYYDKGSPGEDFWKAYICRSDGVFRSTFKVVEGVENYDETKIFSRPLVLADAWHSEGDEENQIKFTFFLGDLKYQGTKGEVSTMIIESGLTGIVPNSIKLTVAACVEYYVSAGMVKVRESYEAIGVYSKNGGFEIALADKDISAMRGTEPWYVFRSFRPYQGNVRDDVETFNRLWEFYSRDVLALFYGMAAVAPFSYAMRKDGNYFWPLFILKGPRSTGKTTLGQLFTHYLYGVTEGGPSDVTSDFRLLDFVTGTTFPRLIDESENAKFEGQRFSIKISTTLKDAAQKQFVGSRGNIEKTKKLYAARTPLILAGNKIDIEDPALLARSIIVSMDIGDTKTGQERRLFSNEILRSINHGFGIKLVEFVANRFASPSEFVTAIKNKVVDYQFSDPRREDFYASIYVGLQAWNDFCASFGVPFSLSEYLDEEKFIKLVKKFEESNNEESQERQSVLLLVDWAKTRVGLMENLFYSGDKRPTLYYELEQMFKKVDIEGKQWIYLTQTALSEFRKAVPQFQESNLSEAAEALSKYFGVGKEIFYDRNKTEYVASRNARVLRIPLDGLGLGEYGGGVGGSGEEPPPNEKLHQLHQHSTRGGGVARDSVAAIQEDNSTTFPRKTQSGYFTSKEESMLENNEKSGGVVENNTQNNTGLNMLTPPLTPPDSTSGEVRSYEIVSTFYDGLLYSEGQVYNWDSSREFVKRLLVRGKIAEIKTPELTMEQKKHNLEKIFKSNVEANRKEAVQ